MTRTDPLIEPFLLKQGIESIKPYLISQFQRSTPMVIGSKEEGKYLIIAFKDGQILEEEQLLKDKLLDGNAVSLQSKKYQDIIDYVHRKKMDVDVEFEVIRNKWHIPSSHKEFFKLLSCGQGAVFLPDMVRHRELVYDIECLCTLPKLKLRPRVPQEYWVVCAYLFFGEMIYTNLGELTFSFLESIRLFKVESDSGYRLYIELSPSLQSYDWIDLYERIERIQLEGSFIEGNGTIGGLARLLEEDVSNAHRTRLVYSIPLLLKRKKGVWEALYPLIRSTLDDHYGIGTDLRDHIPNKKWELEFIKKVEKIEHDENIEREERKNDPSYNFKSRINNALFDRLSTEIVGCVSMTDDELRKYWARHKKKRNYYYVEYTHLDDQLTPTQIKVMRRLKRLYSQIYSNEIKDDNKEGKILRRKKLKKLINDSSAETTNFSWLISAHGKL